MTLYIWTHISAKDNGYLFLQAPKTSLVLKQNKQSLQNIAKPFLQIYRLQIIYRQGIGVGQWLIRDATTQHKKIKHPIYSDQTS